MAKPPSKLRPLVIAAAQAEPDRTWSSIAAEHGANESYVWRILSAAGMTSPGLRLRRDLAAKLPPDTVLAAELKSCRHVDIAHKYGVDPAFIRRQVTRIGAGAKKRVRKLPNDQTLMGLLTTVHWSDIAAAFQVTSPAVSYQARRLGFTSMPAHLRRPPARKGKVLQFTKAA